MTLLIAAVLLQPKLDFGPEIVSLADLCRAYIPAGTEVQIDGLDDRFVVAHLKERTWPGVQALLTEEMGLEFIQRPDGPLQIRLSPARAAEEARLGGAAMNAVSRAVAARARELAPPPELTWNGARREARELRQRLTDRAMGYRQHEWQKFAELNRDDLARLGWLQFLDDRDRWAQLQLIRHQGPQGIFSPEPFTMIDSESGIFDLLKLPPRSAEMAPAMAVRQRFDWTAFVTMIDFAADDADWQPRFPQPMRFPEAEAAFLRLWEPPRLDGLDEVLQANAPFTPVEEAAGVHTEAFKQWASQTDAELLAEIHPLVDLNRFNVSAPPTKTFAEMIRYSSTRPPADWIAPPPSRGAQPDEPMNERSVEGIAMFVHGQSAELLPDMADRIRREYSATARDGVLVLRLTVMPFYQRLALDAAAYYRTVEGAWMTMNGIHEYAQSVDAESNARWLAVQPDTMQAGRIWLLEMAKVHPFLKGLESIGPWEVLTGSTGGAHTVELTGPAAQQAWEGLAAMGDPLALLVQAGHLPPAPFQVKVNVTPLKGYRSITVTVRKPFQGERSSAEWSGQFAASEKSP